MADPNPRALVYVCALCRQRIPPQSEETNLDDYCPCQRRFATLIMQRRSTTFSGGTIRRNIENSGLSEKLILENLAPEDYNPSPSEDSEEAAEQCGICLVKLKKGDVVGRMRCCTHNFHFDCIRQWLMEKNSCPFCKRTPIEVPPLPPSEPQQNRN